MTLAQKEKTMKKLFQNIGHGAVRAGILVGRFFGSVEKVDEIYRDLTPEAKAAALKTFQDVLTFVAAAEAAAAAQGENFVLDGAVLATARQLYADAVLDIDSAKKVFAALGVSLAAPAVPKAA